MRLSFTKDLLFRAKSKRTLSLSWSWPEYHGLCITLSFSLRLHTLQSKSPPSCVNLPQPTDFLPGKTLPVLALLRAASEWLDPQLRSGLLGKLTSRQLGAKPWQTKRPLFVPFSLRVCHFLSVHLVPILRLGTKQNINFFAASQTHTSYTWGMAPMAGP